MDERIKKELNLAIIDCFYVIDVILNDLPDIDKVVILRDIIQCAMTFIVSKDCKTDASCKLIEIMINNFRKMVLIDKYDRKDFVEHFFFDKLADEDNFKFTPHDN